MSWQIAKYIRATRRAALGLAALPLFAGLTVLQAVVGPLTGNYTAIPKIVYNVMRKLFGFKIEFNAASAPLVKDKPTWFVSNHMSMADFIVAGCALDGIFVGKAEILNWPVVGRAARTTHFIGVRRQAEFNNVARGAIIENFNTGHNTIMFPEGTTSEGKQVHLFHAALIKILFGEKGIGKNKSEVSLQKQVVVQPVALRVKSVEGKDATGNDELRNLYSMYTEENPLKRIWKRMQIKSMTLELTAFQPLNPVDFADAKDLINKAALDIASVVNPGQTTFEKGKIPVTG